MHRLIATPSQLGLQLRSLRRARNLTQAEVGRRIGLSQKRLSVLERHPERLSIAQLLSLAGALGFDVVIQPRSVAAQPTSATSGGDAKPEW